jgi:hypothetical protein
MEYDDIDEAECWGLLATVSLGRIALSINALPAILPVQYHVDGRNLTICLGKYEIGPRSAHGVIVAFSADAIDPPTRSGWSVQVQGRSVLSPMSGIARTCGQAAAGQIVQLSPSTIAGQRIRLCPFPPQG